MAWSGHVAMVSKKRSVPTCPPAILSVAVTLLGGHPRDHQHQDHDHDHDLDLYQAVGLYEDWVEHGHRHQDHDDDADHD